MEGIKGELRAYPVGTAWADQARFLLERVRAQFSELCSFIETYYTDLTQKSRFKAGRAWGLVGRCVGAVFEGQVSIRAVAAMLDDLNSLPSKTLVIGSVLKCHAIIREFELVQYRSHPLIVKELSLFMLTEWVDPLEMETMESRVLAAEEASKAAKAALAAHKSVVDGLKKELGDLSQELKTVKSQGKRKKPDD